ncbi:hypothetical protein I7I48_00349 [Histoplasma ohiense]|nr:hypothetical protein I7I48_00349 [Histoplasma ohiense (nom. inval.)]
MHYSRLFCHLETYSCNITTRLEMENMSTRGIRKFGVVSSIYCIDPIHMANRPARCPNAISARVVE